MGFHYIRSTVAVALSDSSASDDGLRYDIAPVIPNAIPDSDDA